MLDLIDLPPTSPHKSIHMFESCRGGFCCQQAIHPRLGLFNQCDRIDELVFDNLSRNLQEEVAIQRCRVNFEEVREFIKRFGLKLFGIGFSKYLLALGRSLKKGLEGLDIRRFTCGF